jgi:LPS sulfotransferase NodH
MTFFSKTLSFFEGNELSGSLSAENARATFIILMNGRCGSSLLVSYLNQIPDLLCYPEILHNLSASRQQEILYSFLKGNEHEILGESELGYSGISRKDKDMDKLVASGFKVKWGDLAELDAFLSICRNNQIKLLYLTRTNIFKSALSRYQALKFYEEYGDYVKTSEDQILAPIHIDITEFERLLAQEEYFYHALNDIVIGYGVTVPGMTYEELVVEPVKSINIFLEHLSSSYRIDQQINNADLELFITHFNNNDQVRPLQQRVIKMTPEDYSSIDNRTEFIEYFKQTKFAEMLNV